jgi:hypothetical protein
MKTSPILNTPYRNVHRYITLAWGSCCWLVVVDTGGLGPHQQGGGVLIVHSHAPVGLPLVINHLMFGQLHAFTVHANYLIIHM